MENNSPHQGHPVITRQAVHDLFAQLPEGSKVLGHNQAQFFDSLNRGQEYADRIAGGKTWLPSILVPGAQREHSMADPRHSGVQALHDVRDFVATQLALAAGAHIEHDSKAEMRYLGAAIHAVQDSYSSAHVFRDPGDPSDPRATIQSFNIWDPGQPDHTHSSEFDKTHATDDKPNRPADQAAEQASVDVLKGYLAVINNGVPEFNASVQTFLHVIDPFFVGAPDIHVNDAGFSDQFQGEKLQHFDNESSHQPQEINQSTPIAADAHTPDSAVKSEAPSKSTNEPSHEKHHSGKGHHAKEAVPEADGYRGAPDNPIKSEGIGPIGAMIGIAGEAAEIAASPTLGAALTTGIKEWLKESVGDSLIEGMDKIHEAVRAHHGQAGEVTDSGKGSTTPSAGREVQPENGRFFTAKEYEHIVDRQINASLADGGMSLAPHAPNVSPDGGMSIPPNIPDGGQNGGMSIPPYFIDGTQDGGMTVAPHEQNAAPDGGMSIPSNILDGGQNGSMNIPPHIDGTHDGGMSLPPHILDGNQDNGMSIPPHITDGGQDGGMSIPPHTHDNNHDADMSVTPHLYDGAQDGGMSIAPHPNEAALDGGMSIAHHGHENTPDPGMSVAPHVDDGSGGAMHPDSLGPQNPHPVEGSGGLAEPLAHHVAATPHDDGSMSSGHHG
jgi:hypothetical protein